MPFQESNKLKKRAYSWGESKKEKENLYKLKSNLGQKKTYSKNDKGEDSNGDKKHYLLMLATILQFPVRIHLSVLRPVPPSFLTAEEKNKRDKVNVVNLSILKKKTIILPLQLLNWHLNGSKQATRKWS